MNLADSERLAGVLDAAGYHCAEEASDADVIIYNSCSIRDKAKIKVYSAIGRQVLAVGPCMYMSPCGHRDVPEGLG